MPRSPSNEQLWAHHHAQVRDPHQVLSQWQWASDMEPALLEHFVRGRWWDAVAEAGITLIVSREYEHLLLALGWRNNRPQTSYFRLPHPSGVAFDAKHETLHVASTRNPNMVFDFAAYCDQRGSSYLAPASSRTLPGKLYLHDLAMIGDKLCANAVGMNAIVRLPAAGGFEPIWWPHVIDGPQAPAFDRNYLQMNSIAAGASLANSYFSASTDRRSFRRPGHLNFPVDRRGVIFCGRTRDVIATGLTRPHSARRRGREIWVDNSGYGELGRICQGRFEPLVKLSGWTRGLCFHNDLAFVGTSRVIPRYRHYAPGLDVDASECGIHAIDMRTGKVQGSLLWPHGNQIFAICTVPASWTRGFPFVVEPSRTSARFVQSLFSAGRRQGRVA